jgi:hypothetical protein
MTEENRKSYEAQLKAEVAVLTEMVRVLSDRIAQMDSEKRPQNCGTGYCSCIECVMKNDPNGT